MGFDGWTGRVHYTDMLRRLANGCAGGRARTRKIAGRQAGASPTFGEGGWACLYLTVTGVLMGAVRLPDSGTMRPVTAEWQGTAAPARLALLAV